MSIRDLKAALDGGDDIFVLDVRRLNPKPYELRETLTIFEIFDFIRTRHYIDHTERVPRAAAAPCFPRYRALQGMHDCSNNAGLTPVLDEPQLPLLLPLLLLLIRDVVLAPS